MLARSVTARNRSLLLLAYAVVAVLGRTSIIEGGAGALVWPAAGVAVAWFLTERSTAARLVGTAAVAAAAALACLVTGTGGSLCVIVVASHLVGMLAVVDLVRRWAAGGGRAPLDHPRALFGFLAAAAAGCLIGVGIGAALLLAVGESVPVVGAFAWWGRNVCGVVGLGIITLLLLERSGGASDQGAQDDRLAEGGRIELAGLLASTAVLVAVDALASLPMTFLMPAMTVWAGMRFTTLVVAGHALVAGVATLGLALAGHGPFSEVGDPVTSVLLTQLFVAMTFAVGLFLVAMRRRTVALQDDLLAQERDQQQELLTFAHRVAHDLRTPLTVIDGWNEELVVTLDRTPFGPPPGAGDIVEGIARASNRMRTLVDDLLADATARERVPEPREVDLEQIVAEVAGDHGAQAAVHTQVDGPVCGDPVLIRQLLENLIGNALKYSRPDAGPDVTVSTRRGSGGRVLVSIADRGVGIPEDAQDWIFEPFRRAHTGAVPGSGLGLSTCRRIVERHGGSIRARSRPDGPGAVIEFDLMGTR